MSQMLSVMVWIHGGYFLEGGGNIEQFGPEYLIQKENVIIVTFNYRLGIFGKRSLSFLTLSNHLINLYSSPSENKDF